MRSYYFSHGRTALLNGLKFYNFSDHDAILIPDYLCEVVELTLRSLNLKILKYEMKDNFTINMQSLKSKLKLRNLKAIMVVNYFGFPQNIKVLKKICKKNKILLIEDNSHGYGGKENSKLLGTRGNLGFSSPRKVLQIYSGGILYHKNIVSIKLPKYKRTIKDFIIELLSKNFSLKTLIKKNLIFRKDFSDLTTQNDNIIYNTSIDDFSLSKIRQKNIKIEKLKRFNNYKIWKNYLIKNNFKPIFKNANKNLMIWCLPFYAKNASEAKKWFDWGQKQGITIFSWPDLSIDNINKNSKCFKRWKKLICLPLDIPNNYLKHICN